MPDHPSGGARSVPQADQRDVIVLGARDHDRQVLVLLVEPVEEGELLPAVCRIVDGIHVERDPRRRFGEGVQTLRDESLTQPLQVRDRDRGLSTARGGSNRDSVG